MLAVQYWFEESVRAQEIQKRMSEKSQLQNACLFYAEWNGFDHDKFYNEQALHAESGFLNDTAGIETTKLQPIYSLYFIYPFNRWGTRKFT